MDLISGEKKGPTLVDIMAKRLDLKRRLSAFFFKARLKSGMSYEEIEAGTGLLGDKYRAWEQGFQIPEMKDAAEVMAFLGEAQLMDFHMLFTEILIEADQYKRDINTPIVS